MRLILKLIAAPVALVLVVACNLFSFVLSMSEVLLGIVSGIVFIGAAVLFFTGQTVGGIAWLVVAFLISPFGLPAFAGWIVRLADRAKDALTAFIFS